MDPLAQILFGIAAIVLAANIGEGIRNYLTNKGKDNDNERDCI